MKRVSAEEARECAETDLVLFRNIPKVASIAFRQGEVLICIRALLLLLRVHINHLALRFGYDRFI